jgi:predicted secreted Zn-dependent protease
MIRSNARRIHAIARSLLSLACTVLSAACASAPHNPVLDKYPPGVSGRTTILYYDVHGRTVEELRADMRRLGPKIDGTSFVGETRSPMRWNWRTESIGGSSCSIREVSVLVNAQITLPRWTPPPDTEPGLPAEWKRFMAALETHESGHKDISAKAGREIIERVRGISGPCSQIGARANDFARVIVERAHEQQQAYDAETRHGLTQGTMFGVRRFGGMTVGNVLDTARILAGMRVGTVRGSLPASFERAWAALPAAYAANGLAINSTESSLHVVADTFTARGTIGTVPVSDIVDCGTPPTGRNADSVAVSMSVTSRLEPSQPSTTTVTNTLAAIVRQPEGAPIGCRSRGVLERRLFETLLNQVAR